MYTNKIRGLTSYPLASFREFLTMAVPLILFSLSGALMSFLDRLFLSYYSIEALEACTATLALNSSFQMPVVRVVSIIQVFIGNYVGSKAYDKVGRSVWQMIWLSLLLSLITIPMGLMVEKIFFYGTEIADLGTSYFRILLPMNLLLPINAALSSFYVGLGNAKTVLYVTFVSHFIHLLIDPLLIFGYKDLFPSLGIQGAAIATLIGQTILCVILFTFFLSNNNRILYHTSEYRFDRRLLWNYLKIGIPRSLSRVVSLFSWSAVVRLINIKGSTYLLALSFGTTIHLLFLFMIDGMGQAILAIGSYILGSRQIDLIQKLIKNAILLISLGAILLSIPYLFYPDLIISFVLPDLLDVEERNILRYTCYWSLMLFIAQALNSIGHNLLTVFHDTLFQLIYSVAFGWLITYGSIYCLFELGDSPADRIWLASSAACLLTAGVYYLRSRKISLQLKAVNLSLESKGRGGQ